MNVKLLEPGNTMLELSAALLLYKSNLGQVYATSHDIVDHPHINGARQIGPGMPATREALSEFAAAVLASSAYRGMVPANLLYTAPDVMAWWTPAARRRVWFKSLDPAIGTASADVAHPPLVFVASAAKWYVFALRDDARPGPGTRLFKAPYFNVYDNGAICTGNVDLPQARGPDAIAAYETAFFRSRFTHPNDSYLVKFAGGASALWAQQLAAPETELITPGILISKKMTFDQTMNHITKDER